MGFQFKKTRDEDNRFDICDIAVSVDSNDLSAEKLLDVFKQFMVAVGYHRNWVDAIHMDDVEPKSSYQVGAE